MNYAFIKKSKYKKMEQEHIAIVNKLAAKKGFVLDTVIQGKELQEIIKSLNKEDNLFFSSASDLGGNFQNIVKNIEMIQERGILIHIGTTNPELEEHIQDIDFLKKIVLFQKEIYSKRTKEALQIKKIEGVILGRPRGNAKSFKLDIHKKEIQKLIGKASASAIARKFNVHRVTMSAYIDLIEKESLENEVNTKTTLKHKLKPVRRNSTVSIINHKKIVKTAIEYHSLEEVAKTLGFKESIILKILN